MKRKFLSKKHMAVILSAALAAGSLSMVPAEFAGMAAVYAQEADSTEEPAEKPGFQFEIAEEEGATGAQWVAGEDGNGSLTLDMGAATTLKIKGEVGEVTVDWKSSDEKVIKVEDAEGGKKVTALSPGKATITATIPAKEESETAREGEGDSKEPQAVLTCEVTVLNYYLAGAEGTELNEEGNLTLDLNGEGNLEIKGDLTDKKVEWKADDSQETPVIELTPGGSEESREQDAQSQGTASIKAMNPGTVTVTATVTEVAQEQAEEETTPEPVTLTCEVEVLDYYLSADALNLKVKGTGSLEVKGVPADGKIVWETKDEKVATVAEGTVTAVNPGTTEITASIMPAEAAEAENEEETPKPLKVLTCKVTVADYELEPTAMELDLDEPEKTLVLTAKEDVTFENVTVTAVSDHTEVVSVEEVKEAEEAEEAEEKLPSKKFTVTAKQAGEAQITVTIVKNEAQQAEEGEEVKAVPETHTCLVTVAEKAVESVTISPKTTKVAVGKTVALTAAVAPENATNKDVAWSTSDSSKATVENGVVTGIAAGEVTITATSVSDDTKKDTCTVTVEAAGGTGNGGSNNGGTGNGGTGNGGSNNGGTGNTNPTTVAVTGITLNKTSISLNKGKTEVLTATVAPANATNKTVTWSTSNAKVATVANGTVTAVGKGTATITAKAGDQTATCRVNVTETKAKVAAKKVVLNTKQIYMVKGKSVTVKATITPSNTTDKVKWSTSNKKVATVKNGKISGKKNGKATITAKAGSKKATVKVNVVSKAKKSTKVTLNKKKATLKVKKTLALKATLKPAKSTDTIKWSSSNKKVAKVDKFGTVTAVKKGKATITAKTSSGKKATCKITVK